MIENNFQRWLGTDNDHCKLVVEPERLDQILGETADRVAQVLGQGPTPKVFLDLEHLQVADYSTFEGMSDAQRQHMARLHSQEPIRSDEMNFLALRSLFQFTWPLPENDDDIRYAAAHDHVLNQIL